MHEDNDYRRWRHAQQVSRERPLARSFGAEDLVKGARVAFEAADGQLRLGTVLAVDVDPETAQVIVPADDPVARVQRVAHAAIRAVEAPEPLRRAFGPDDMVRGYEATFATPEGHQLVGTILDWGRTGTKVHVLDDLRGDHIRKVDYAALRGVRPGTEAAVARATRPPQPGDLVNVATPAGLLLDVLVSGAPDREGQLEVALDDGRRRVHRRRLRDIRPAAGQARLAALRARWAEHPGTDPDPGHPEAPRPDQGAARAGRIRAPRFSMQ